jgi:hypothetical protein
MSEIKVGEYVRNKYGIAKVIDIENNNGIDVLVFDKNICFLVNKETGEIKEDKLFNKLAIIEGVDIEKIKHSPNIIDLIEEGDFVEINYYGGKVIETVIRDNNELCIGLIEHQPAYINLKDVEILSIVTKEQFNQVKYEV